eukprot:8416611-Alexandrium_andersonii.AAC.1
MNSEPSPSSTASTTAPPTSGSVAPSVTGPTAPLPPPLLRIARPTARRRTAASATAPPTRQTRE